MRGLRDDFIKSAVGHQFGKLDKGNEVGLIPQTVEYKMINGNRRRGTPII